MKRKSSIQKPHSRHRPLKEAFVTRCTQGHHCSRDDSGQQCRRQSVVCTFTTFCMERTDTLWLGFPFFLFIMGISTYISLNKFNFNVSLQVVTKILKRTFLILCIGWAIGWFDHVCEGDFLPFVHLRIPGVLQRIALCYCVISFTALLWIISSSPH